MIMRLKQVLFLYLRNPFFLIGISVYAISALLSKKFILSDYFFLGEEFATMLFVVSLWLALHMGILLKRQFANHRASLFPGYRKVHVLVFAFLYVFCTFIAIWWDYGLATILRNIIDGKEGMYVIGLFAAGGITYLGYLSIRRSFIYLYAFLFILAIFCTDILIAFDQYPLLKYIVFAGWLTLIYFFIQRLFVLKEDHFEYKHLLSLSRKVSGVASEHAKKYVTYSQKQPFKPYPKQGNIWTRAQHWMQMDSGVIQSRLRTVLYLIPLYAGYLYFASDSFEDIYPLRSNILLMSVTPVILTVSTYYAKILYWGYDVLKPISKQHYFKEMGVAIFLTHIKYWLAFALCFAFLPAALYSTQEVFPNHYWAHVGFTMVFSAFILMYMLYLASFAHSRKVIFHGLFLSLVIQIEFSYVEELSSQFMILNSSFCLLGAIILGRLAFRGWINNQFK